MTESTAEKLAKEHAVSKNTVERAAKFYQEVHAFRLDCDATQGGSEFSKKGCEWLGCDKGQLARWDAVGRRSGELLSTDNSLPISERAISDLARWDAVGRRSGELVSGTHKLPASEYSISQIASLDDAAFQKAMPQIRVYPKTEASTPTPNAKLRRGDRRKIAVVETG